MLLSQCRVYFGLRLLPERGSGSKRRFALFSEPNSMFTRVSPGSKSNKTFTLKQMEVAPKRCTVQMNDGGQRGNAHPFVAYDVAQQRKLRDLQPAWGQG